MPNSPQLKPKLLENQRYYANHQQLQQQQQQLQQQNHQQYVFDPTTEPNSNTYVIPGLQLEQRCLQLEFQLHRSEQICGILELKVS